MSGELNMEELFERATEDVSGYRWAVEKWIEGGEEEAFPRDYLLILLLGGRSRARRALDALKSRKPPESYGRYGDRLASMFEGAEEKLRATVIEKIPAALEEQAPRFEQRLRLLGKGLDRVKGMAEDRESLDDSEEADEELREEAHDFLLRFLDLALFKEEAESVARPKATEGFASFRNSFEELDRRFHDGFSSFAEVADLVETVRHAEYGLDRWFLEAPSPAEPEYFGDEEVESFAGKLARVFPPFDLRTASPCSPEDEMKAVACALGELPATEHISVRRHLLGCRSCLELFLAAREAAAEVEQMSDEQLRETREMPWERAEEMSADPDPGLRAMDTIKDKIEKLYDAWKDGLTSLAGVAPVYAKGGVSGASMHSLAGAAFLKMPVYPFDVKKASTHSLETEACIRLNVKPRRGKISIPAWPDADKDERQRQLRDFLQRIREYHTAGLAWKEDEERVEIASRRQGASLKHKEKDEGFTYLLICLGTVREDVEKARDALREWTDEPGGSLARDVLPDGVVLLVYKVVRD